MDSGETSTPSKFWRVVPVALFLAGAAAVLLTQRGIGLTWDEGFYYGPSKLAAEWIGEIFKGNQPFDAASIEKYWALRCEHPSMQRLLSGIALIVDSNPHRYMAMRLPMAFVFGLTLVFVYLIGRMGWGPRAGLVAAVIYATLPRIFGHSHIASLEPPLLLMMVAVTYCFLRGLESWRWSIATGIAFGLLLDAKLNGFFLPIPLILWAHIYARQKYVNNLFSMLTLGPATMVAGWPWLWHDTAHRFVNYLLFHTTHQKTSLFFMGTIWGGQGIEHTAPWFYPAVMITVTVPLTAALLIALGTARSLSRPRREPIAMLCLMIVAVMMAVASAPGTPKYDGVRLFLPVFPFLALLGGAGFAGLIESVKEMKYRRMACAVAVLVLLADGGSAIGRYHPFLLSYFNPLAGGLRGSVGRFETVYWGEGLNEETANAINHLPDGARVKALALNDDCLALMQEWGMIKPTIRLGGKPPWFDYHVLQMRQGRFSRVERTLAEDKSGQFPAVCVQSKFGVPMIAIYRTGERFEAAWRAKGYGTE
ncbi:glycosyltransferase family 39 protein [bacterium]|nr:glycosyltransferase family 39 protein [bacterium]